MASISFYRQARADGGIRTGITVNDLEVMGSFAGNQADTDPSLLWFVDVTCVGRLPMNRDAARNWLLENGAVISAKLDRLGTKLETGIDVAWPITKTELEKGIKIKVTCSAIRRLDRYRIGKIVRRVARNFRSYVRNLDSGVTTGV